MKQPKYFIVDGRLYIAWLNRIYSPGFIIAAISFLLITPFALIVTAFEKWNRLNAIVPNGVRKYIDSKLNRNVAKVVETLLLLAYIYSISIASWLILDYAKTEYGIGDITHAIASIFVFQFVNTITFLVVKYIFKFKE